MIEVNVRIDGSIPDAAEKCVEQIKSQLEGRAYRGANELRNASLLVLRGQGGGRSYPIPGIKKKRGVRRESGVKSLDEHLTTKKIETQGYYTASAPGSPPAVRTGAFRNSWQPSAHVAFDSYISRIESEQRTDNGRYNLGELLENGTSKMAPRPHHEKIQQKALPAIKRIYDEPYF